MKSYIKSGGMDTMEHSKYGDIFRCLRIAQDKSLRDISERVSSAYTYLQQIESGKTSIPLVSFISLCNGYDIKPSKFMEIAEKVWEKDLSFNEILLLCAKHEGKKASNIIPINSNGNVLKIGLILKSIRITMGKTSTALAYDMSSSLSMVSNIEKGRIVPSEQTLKKYLAVFKMSSTEFENLYNEVVTRNLSYPQILSRCLTYDIKRQNKESLQSQNK